LLLRHQLPDPRIRRRIYNNFHIAHRSNNHHHANPISDKYDHEHFIQLNPNNHADTEHKLHHINNDNLVDNYTDPIPNTNSENYAIRLNPNNHANPTSPNNNQLHHSNNNNLVNNNTNANTSTDYYIRHSNSLVCAYAIAARSYDDDNAACENGCANPAAHDDVYGFADRARADYYGRASDDSDERADGDGDGYEAGCWCCGGWEDGYAGCYEDGVGGCFLVRYRDRNFDIA
jgi:hypothetical protein